MAAAPIRHAFTSSDGQELVWHELWPEGGGGRPVLLIHGLFSDADTNWIRYGHAAALTRCGFRVIMPDLRAHGHSAKPHDAAAYPPDVLVRDGLELIEHLGLTDYDLVGYSLGGRTAVRMVVKGARPRRLVVSGMGLQGLLGTANRADHFKKILKGLGTHPRGSPEWMAEAFLKTTGGDAEALLPLLDSFVDTSEMELKRLAVPTLVLSGEDDRDNGSSKLWPSFSRRHLRRRAGQPHERRHQAGTRPCPSGFPLRLSSLRSGPQAINRGHSQNEDVAR